MKHKESCMEAQNRVREARDRAKARLERCMKRGEIAAARMAHCREKQHLLLDGREHPRAECYTIDLNWMTSSIVLTDKVGPSEMRMLEMHIRAEVERLVVQSEAACAGAAASADVECAAYASIAPDTAAEAR